MIKIPLALRDFQEIIENKLNLEERNVYPIFVYEDEVEIFFYKVIGYVLYYVGLIKDKLPEDIILENLIRNFGATEIFEQLHITVYITKG